jgi:hypothetical protein
MYIKGLGMANHTNPVKIAHGRRTIRGPNIRNLLLDSLKKSCSSSTFRHKLRILLTAQNHIAFNVRTCTVINLLFSYENVGNYLLNFYLPVAFICTVYNAQYLSVFFFVFVSLKICG